VTAVERFAATIARDGLYGLAGSAEARAIIPPHGHQPKTSLRAALSRGGGMWLLQGSGVSGVAGRVSEADA